MWKEEVEIKEEGLWEKEQRRKDENSKEIRRKKYDGRCKNRGSVKKRRLKEREKRKRKKTERSIKEDVGWKVDYIMNKGRMHFTNLVSLK